MRNLLKQSVAICLVTAFLLVLATPVALANDNLAVSFNSHEFNAQVYLENGVTYISTESLGKIPGIQVDEGADYIPLRQFFENIGAQVSWDGNNRAISISYNETNDQWNAKELMLKSNEALYDFNTHKMSGNTKVQISISGLEEEIPQLPSMDTIIEANIQYDPLKMYIKQIVDMPLEEMGISKEEAAEIFGDDAKMVTEMVWADNGIYQKMPMQEQWIVQDMAALGGMENFTQLMQTSPQQSMEMLAKYDVFYVFGDDIQLNGNEYYTLKTKVDTETMQQIIKDMFEELELTELLTAGMNVPESDELQAELDQAMDIINKVLESLETEYTCTMLINKDTLTTDHMDLDMKLSITIDESIVPEGPITIDINIAGDFVLYDYGTDFQLPDLSNSISQQEYFEQVMNEIVAIPTEVN